MLAAKRAVTKLLADIRILPSTIIGVDDLIRLLLSMPSVQEQFENLAGPKKRHVLTEPTPDGGQSPTTEDIWSAVLLAEEAVLPEVEVSAVSRWDNTASSRLLIPYTKVGEPIDYESGDEIEVLREFQDDWVRLGYLSTADTNGSNLVLEKLNLRHQIEIGERLKFRSKQDLSSYRRRRDAVSRITAEESVIPNLLSYFDPVNCPEPIKLEDEPSSEQMDAYTVRDGDEVVFSLNELQRKAFAKLWSYGPLGLLQGPPGTGKTAFIASFVHFAFSRGARNILLASQSHEAVNNAAEKIVELCVRTGITPNIVRFGAEGMVSDPLRPYHSSEILESYRAVFRAEIRQRVSTLSGNLGLPSEFVGEWFDVDYSFTKMLQTLAKLTVTDEAIVHHRTSPVRAEINRLRERISAIATGRFHHVGDRKSVV